MFNRLFPGRIVVIGTGLANGCVIRILRNFSEKMVGLGLLFGTRGFATVSVYLWGNGPLGIGASGVNGSSSPVARFFCKLGIASSVFKTKSGVNNHHNITHSANFNKSNTTLAKLAALAGLDNNCIIWLL
jgi:hypothetical protein